jgi:hypothetical protein
VDAARTVIAHLRRQQIVAHVRHACLRFKSENYTAAFVGRDSICCGTWPVGYTP